MFTVTLKSFIMALFNQFHNSIKKATFGFVALFLIKVLLFSGALIIQSCSVDKETETIEAEEFVQNAAMLKFKLLVHNTAPMLNTLTHQTKKGSAIVTMSTQQDQEQQAKTILMPLVESSKELLAAYHFTEADLAKEFDDLNDPRILIIGLAMLAAESETANQTAMNFASMFGTFVYANKYWDCAVRALGFSSAGLAALSKGKLTKSAIKMAVKVAARSVGGWLAAGFIIADFTSCMGYW